MDIAQFRDKTKPSGFLSPLFDNSKIDQIKEVASQFAGTSTVFLVGIGGSNLATKAVWEALWKEDKEVFFLESLDGREQQKIKEVINKISDPKDFCLIVSSKSGNTRETLDTYKKVEVLLSEKFGDKINQRTLVITGKNGALREIALRYGFKILDWDGEIGGRYSAFSVAHTLPLEILGTKTKQLKEGGQSVVNDSELLDKVEVLASKIRHLYESGTDIIDLFTFNSQLEALGDWTRQLIAESIGKTSEEGEKIDLTPIVSIGPRDLHSMLQLDLGGKKKRFTIFLYTQEEAVGSIEASSYQEILTAYMEKNIPYYEFIFEKVDEYNIGRYFAFMMLLTVSVCRLLKVDPYNQPAVEEYKANLR